MAEIDLADDLEDARHYLENALGPDYNDALVRAYLEAAPEMVRFVEANTHVRFEPSLLPDYEPSHTGAHVGRTMFTKDFDGREMGALLRRLRPARAELTLQGMQFNFADAAIAMKVTRSPKAALYMLRLLGRFITDKLRHGRTTRLVGGNALAARLLLSAAECGVALRAETAAVELIEEEGAVRGLMVEHQGKRSPVRARFGVVLASGGYGANDAMRRMHLVQPDEAWSYQPRECSGDGISMAQRLGGRHITDNAANAIWMPMSVEHNPTGEDRTFAHFALDRHLPGAIAVNDKGIRFVNEAFHYQHFVNTMNTLGLKRAYLIMDHRFLRRYGAGLVRPAPFRFGKHLRSGYLMRGRSILELSRMLDLPPGALASTVARYNDGARRGADPEFRRGEDVYSTAMGDLDHTPNPNVAPIKDGPFYAITLHPGDLCTVSGLEADGEARVIGAEGAPIEGLYAAGLDMNSLVRGHYPAGGLAIGPAMTFGYIAAKNIAR